MNRNSKLATVALALTAVVPMAAVAQKPKPAKLSLSANPTTIVFGKSTVLSGKLTGPKADGKSIQVQADPHPFEGNFGNVGNATTDAQGKYTFAHSPAENTHYRAKQGSSLSGIATVLVRIRASLRRSDATPKRGSLVRLYGRACPQHDGAIVKIQRRTSKGGWRTVRRTTLRDIAGSTCSKYSKRFRVYSDGTYRAFVTPDANHASGISALRRLNVHR
jgi:hypothetical protein